MTLVSVAISRAFGGGGRGRSLLAVVALARCAGIGRTGRNGVGGPGR